jgi:NADH dehydrogenase
MTHRVVIVGGGFAGLTAAQKLKHAPVTVTLIDRRNFYLFQPLLYQVATGALSPGEIAAPIRNILHRQKNAIVLLGEVSDIDVAGREVIFCDGGKVPYDSLIVATGSTHHYFNHPEWAAFAPGLKTVEDATAMRARILFAFEAGEAPRMAHLCPGGRRADRRRACGRAGRDRQRYAAPRLPQHRPA